MKTLLEILALITQIISFPIAAYAIFISARSSKRDREVELVLSLSESFRSRWEQSWRTTLNEVEALKEDETINQELEERLKNILNWLDWMGWLIEEKILHREEIILNSIGYQLNRAIRIGQKFIDQDTERHGKDYWKGIRLLKRKLKVLIQS